MSLTWNKPLSVIVEERVGSDAFLLYAATTARHLMDKFVPMDTGSLADNVNVYVENGMGIVHYISPYARYPFYGTHMKFGTEKHAFASAGWHKPMVQAHGAELAAALQKYIDRG